MQANLKELDWSVPKPEKKGKGGKANKVVAEEADNWLDEEDEGANDDRGSYEPAMHLLSDAAAGEAEREDPDFAASEDVDAKREKKRLKKEAKKLAKREKKLAMQHVLDESADHDTSNNNAAAAVKTEGEAG